MKVIEIKYEECENWLLNIHYAKRIPMISHSFGLYKDKNLKGVITYGLPPSPDLCRGICGEQYKDKVLELNRLVLEDNIKNYASYFIAKTLKLIPKPKIIVSFADASMNHNGYVYQATNFLYTGLSAKRTEWVDKETNKHNRRVQAEYSLEDRKNNPERFELIERPRKHRYVYFLGSKVEKKHMIKSLNYQKENYPKGKNINYKITNKPVTQQILF